MFKFFYSFCSNSIFLSISIVLLVLASISLIIRYCRKDF